MEVELALNLGLKVLPVTVQEAAIPAADALPDTIRPLAFLNSAALRPDPDFTRDVQLIVDAILDD